MCLLSAIVISGGSTLRLLNELAVTPIGVSPKQVVTTVTPDAHWANVFLN
jgi:hypothetical protein